MCSMPVPSLPQVHPMRLGLWAINFGACADPELQVRAAVAAEESGFESIWTSEHVAMPIRDNPVPMPPETPFLDSIVSLANVAAHTSRLRLGTGILVMPHHNPVLLAKALATLDLVSGGRLIAGFAGGYVEAEFRALGVAFKERGAITDEYLQAGSPPSTASASSRSRASGRIRPSSSAGGARVRSGAPHASRAGGTASASRSTARRRSSASSGGCASSSAAGRSRSRYPSPPSSR